MPARNPELADKIFCISDDPSVLAEGETFLDVYNPNVPTGFISTIFFYKNGKLHGEPAIKYPDGLEETWENGQFVKTYSLPYAQRDNEDLEESETLPHQAPKLPIKYMGKDADGNAIYGFKADA